VYFGLDWAAKKFPELDVTFRGAVSIGPAAAGSHWPSW